MLIPRIWRRGAAEARASDYSDDVIGRAIDLAGLRPVDATRLAAAQFAANLIGRALASSDVEAPAAIAAAIPPWVLDLAGRCLVLAGECFLPIDTAGGALTLYPATYADCTGGWMPSTWRYRLNVATPTGDYHILRPDRAIVRPVWAVDPRRPWRGISPLQSAGVSTGLAAALEGKLAAEMRTKVKTILPVPFSDAPLENLRKDLGGTDGGLITPPTQASGYGAGQPNAPRSDYKAEHLGPNPNPGMLNLREPALRSVLAALGIPPPILYGDGPQAREAGRQAFHGTIEPLARMVEAELSAKLERPIRLRPRSLAWIDLQARARAYSNLASNGIPPADALERTGFDPDGITFPEPSAEPPDEVIEVDRE